MHSLSVDTLGALSHSEEVCQPVMFLHCGILACFGDTMFMMATVDVASCWHGPWFKSRHNWTWHLSFRIIVVRALRLISCADKEFDGVLR